LNKSIRYHATEPTEKLIRFTVDGINGPTGAGIRGLSTIESEPLRPYDRSKESKMTISRPISRVEFLEALHRGLMTREIISPVKYPEDHYKVRKEDFFKYILNLDPTVSSISLEERWDYFKRKNIHPVGHYQFYMTGKNDYELDYLLSDIKDAIKSFKEEDEKDPSLSTLGEYTEAPALPVSNEQLEALIGIKDELSSLGERYKERADAEYHGYGPNPIRDSLDSINENLSTLASIYQERERERQESKYLGNPIEGSLDLIGDKISTLTETIREQHKGLGRLIELQEQQLLPEPEPEQRELTMAERVKNAALETGEGVASAFQEGLKISGSQQLSKKVVDVFHSKLGHHLPGAETAVGQKIEGFAIPALVHFMASAFSDKIPKADLVRSTGLRAITGEAKDSGDELLGLLLPVFSEIASIDNMADIASQFAVEETSGQLADGSSAGQTLQDYVSSQLNIPEGAKVEVNIITDKKEDENG